MKKTISLLLVLLLTLGLFAACSETEEIETGGTVHYHYYTETVLTPADCRTEGLKECVCDCGDCYTEVIPKTDHDFESTVIRQATCKAAGQEKRVCKVCGYSDTVEIPAAHQYDDSNRCTVCGEVRKIPITDAYSLIQQLKGDWFGFFVYQYYSDNYHPNVNKIFSLEISGNGMVSFLPACSFGLAGKHDWLSLSTFENKDNGMYSLEANSQTFSILYDEEKDTATIFISIDGGVYYSEMIRSKN